MSTSNQSNVVGKEPALAYILSRLQDANARLARLHDDGQATADRVFGPVPEATAAPEGVPALGGMVAMLHLVVDNLHSRITECEADMQRLQEL